VATTEALRSAQYLTPSGILCAPIGVDQEPRNYCVERVD
jgi:hypothetical protein